MIRVERAWRVGYGDGLVTLWAMRRDDGYPIVVVRHCNETHSTWAGPQAFVAAARAALDLCYSGDIDRACRVLR